MSSVPFTQKRGKVYLFMELIEATETVMYAGQAMTPVLGFKRYAGDALRCEDDESATVTGLILSKKSF